MSPDSNAAKTGGLLRVLAASSAASDVNNSGLAVQVAYLVREAGTAETERLIREAAAGAGPPAPGKDDPEGREHHTAAATRT